MQFKYFSFITGLFCACLVISNILDTKLFQIGSAIFPAGIILFPIVYVFGDIFTEVYGYAQSRKAIWAGFFSLLLLALALAGARYLPAATVWEHQSAFETILGKVPRIVLASILAYICGEFVNSYILAKMKLRYEGNYVAFRLILSTVFGQAIDTAVFILIAFTGLMSFHTAVMIFLSAWLFKIIWEIIALPVSMPVIAYLKRVEQVDHFDRNTDFNPFRISSVG